jgi:hypothetical protein
MRGHDVYIGAAEKTPKGEMSSLISPCGAFSNSLLSDPCSYPYNPCVTHGDPCQKKYSVKRRDVHDFIYFLNAKCFLRG